MSRLNDLYKGEIRKSLREKFGYTNEMEIRSWKRSSLTLASEKRRRIQRRLMLLRLILRLSQDRSL
ncbi:MAG: hypothetical protein ACLUIQ_08080 [Dialister invisus]